jgi:hypothetical protein
VSEKCIHCGKTTRISHHVKYFIDKHKTITLGGPDIHGPLCTTCCHNIGDQSLGFPKMLEKERKNARKNT